MPVDRARNVLVPQQSGKVATSCPSWFFGGSHGWSDDGTPRCAVRRRQRPPYQHKWTDYHEWGKDDRCVHCRLTRAEVKPKRTMSAHCLYCGVTRHEAYLQARDGVQPKLGCEDFGHVVQRKALVRKTPIAVITGRRPAAPPGRLARDIALTPRDVPPVRFVGRL